VLTLLLVVLTVGAACADRVHRYVVPLPRYSSRHLAETLLPRWPMAVTRPCVLADRSRCAAITELQASSYRRWPGCA